MQASHRAFPTKAGQPGIFMLYTKAHLVVFPSVIMPVILSINFSQLRSISTNLTARA